MFGEDSVSFDRFTERISSAAELAEIIGAPSIGSLKKELRALDEHMRRFIAHSPFLVMSTHSSDGRSDASPRGDRPGFVHFVDSQTLLIPDRRGIGELTAFETSLRPDTSACSSWFPAFERRCVSTGGRW